MRTAIFLKSDRFQEIPYDFRGICISLIKFLLGSKRNEERIWKPYCFTYFFDESKKEQNKLLTKGVVLKFSSGRGDIISTVIERAIVYKRKKLGEIEGNEKLNGWWHNFSIFTIRVFPPIIGQNCEIYLKTSAPIVVNEKEKPDKTFGPERKQIWIQRIVELLKNKWEILNNTRCDYNVNVEIAQNRGIVPIRHYKGVLLGWKGVLQLRGDAELIKFAYDYGLGIRTGQGFGYLDVARGSYDIKC